MKASAVTTILGLLAVVSALTAATGSGIDAQVFPATASAPADVVVRALIEPDVRNRSVEFVIESAAIFSTSSVALDGDRAPRTRDARFPRLPAGHYEIRVSLVGTGGVRGTVVRHISLY